MLDFILGLFIAALLVRGWVRGLVRETLDLVGLVLGLWIAFRLSAPLGDFLTRSFGVTPEVARIGAGIALFLLFGVSLSIAAHYLTKLMSLPGLGLVNRVGGAAVAVAWAIAIVLVALNVLRVFPIPDSWEDEIDDSVVANAIVGPGALPQKAFDALAGDNVLAALDAIQDIFGTSRAVPEGVEVLSIPAAPADEIRQVRDEAAVIVDEINQLRTGRGLGAVVKSEGISAAAEQRAMGMYASGELFRSQDCLSQLADAGVRVAGCGEAVGLAGTALGAFDGIQDTESGGAEIADSAYDRVGVSVVDGPTGRLVVIILAG